MFKLFCFKKAVFFVMYLAACKGFKDRVGGLSQLFSPIFKKWLKAAFAGFSESDRYHSSQLFGYNPGNALTIKSIANLDGKIPSVF